MVIDSSLYFNEDALFMLRYSELYNLVDVFLVSEGTRTYQGHSRLPEFPYAHLPKVYYTGITDTESKTPWEAEHAHRRSLWDVIYRIADSDHTVVLLSDADEIAHPKALKWYIDTMAPFHSVAVLDQLISYYYLNVRGSIQWQGTRISTVRGIQNHCNRDMQQFRSYPGQVISPGGWHFSFMGGTRAAQAKLRAYAHSEYNTPYWTDPVRLDEARTALRDPFNRDITWCAVPLDNSFPTVITDNPAMYRDYLYPQDTDGSCNSDHHEV